MGAAGRGEDVAQERGQRVGSLVVVGPDDAHRPFDADPLPTRAEHHRRPARPAQVRELAGVAPRDEPDARSPGAGVVEDARVHQRGVDGSVGARGGDHREALVGPDQAAVTTVRP